MALTFPTGLVPASVLFDIENASRSGGVSLNGQEQVVSSMSGRWRATLTSIAIRKDAQVLAWRAFKAAMRGRSGTVLVPVFDARRINWPVDTYSRRLDPGEVRRKRLDGTIFEDPRFPASTQVVARFSSAAALRATTVQIAVDQGAGLQVGQYFSPRPGRLHIVTEALGGGAYRIEPPLRIAEAANTAIDLMTPTCEMRFASDDDGSLDLRLLRLGNISPSFVEAF